MASEEECSTARGCLSVIAFVSIAIGVGYLTGNSGYGWLTIGLIALAIVVADRIERHSKVKDV